MSFKQVYAAFLWATLLICAGAIHSATAAVMYAEKAWTTGLYAHEECGVISTYGAFVGKASQ
jgi:hypothetical protein